MNLVRPSIAFTSHAFRAWLNIRKLLPKRKCRTFGTPRSNKQTKIEKIYVINLDRETRRWAMMESELGRILNTEGETLLSMTERYSAVDAETFEKDPSRNVDINPFYTLEDQLFVEPQPSTLPTKMELNAPIRMSRPEVAVAQSHINLWKRVAASRDEYVLILEDDVWFHLKFGKYLEQAWREMDSVCDNDGFFDVLYLSYLEVKHGAPKTAISDHVFRPMRGLWHLSGYVISRKGAEKLLQLLPCCGPVDLWINHEFENLKVRATKRTIIDQRRDTRSSNSYSILPSLTKIGAINSEGASLFHIRPVEQPVFVFGREGTGLSSIAMALSMLGYRCCSDLQKLPDCELQRLLRGEEDRVFNAYVNIGALIKSFPEIRIRYPNAKIIITTSNEDAFDCGFLDGFDFTAIYLEDLNKWRILCECLRCSPPNCSFPKITDHGQRSVIDDINSEFPLIGCKSTVHDKSPWIVESRNWWRGISVSSNENKQAENVKTVTIQDNLETLDMMTWHPRSDTFTDNLALFRQDNIICDPNGGLSLAVKRESMGVRDYSAASISSRNLFLFGKFEAIIQASDVPGVVTGFFLHRNSPRQEIDVEIPGNRPDLLLVNVFYNPGDVGANFDYGYRGAPTYINLGFDASKSSHRYAIEWSPHEIRWFVDDILVHRRSIWYPTPIPHLPLELHINSWISRAVQFAGRIQKRRLPAMVKVKSVSIEALYVVPSDLSKAIM